MRFTKYCQPWCFREMKTFQAVSMIIKRYVEIGAVNMNCTYRYAHHFCCLFYFSRQIYPSSSVLTVPPSCVIGNYVQPHQQDFSTIFCGETLLLKVLNIVILILLMKNFQHIFHLAVDCQQELSLNSPSGVPLTDLQFPCLVKYNLKFFILSFAFTKRVNAFLNFEKN